MLGVCTPEMQFVYVLPGWEGSVADGRVLRDAISRRHCNSPILGLVGTVVLGPQIRRGKM